MARPGNVWMECPTGEDFSFVKVQTFSGHLHAQVIRVETIQTERAGKLHHCPQRDSSCTMPITAEADCCLWMRI